MNHIPNYKNSFRILKGGKISLVVSAFLASTTLTFAAPSGGVVTSGSANISQTGKVTDITQSTQKASINWNKFNVANDETVNFKQPNVNSITLNRVVGNEKSIINGALNANGQVWILNSNGVLFGKDAKVNTAGLLATTKELSDTDFQAGNYNFKGNSKESVINLGTIDVVNGGSVILAANEVRNEGTIKAVKGKVHLVGAEEYSVNLNGNSLVNLTVNKGVLDALVQNSGTIIADGGEVYLTTNAVNELLKGVVNNTGVIEANSMDELFGKVELFAHGGEVQVGGTLEAKEGFIETSGKDFKILENATVKAGEWLIDPVDVTIDATLASTIVIALGSGDVTIKTDSPNTSTNVTVPSGNQTSTDGNIADGDIYVNSNITWSTDKKLTLNATDAIYVNATIQNTNSINGGVYFEAANTGNKVIFDANGKVIINNVNQLQWMNTALNGTYDLGSNIDASVTSGWNAGKGWNPIGEGSSSNPFRGTFNGSNHTISNLYINDNTKNWVGLFGYAENATIKNIGLINVDITGQSNVGALIGSNSTNAAHVETVTNSYASGKVTGFSQVGGLVGFNENAIIQNSYATVTVNGTDNVGGFLGYNKGEIINSYASGKVTGITKVGGLVGYNGWSSIIEKSFWNTEISNQTKGVGEDKVTTNVVTGLTTNEMIDPTKYTDWDTTNIWGFKTADANAEGYLLGSFAYLKNVTRDEDITKLTLFNSGTGTDTNTYKITNWTQLQNINYNSDVLSTGYFFSLSNNLDTTSAGYALHVKDGVTLANGGKGWNPIGDDTNKFLGKFDGLGHTISNLVINRPSEDNIGLFGFTNEATIKNLGLVNVDIKGAISVGGLVGVNYYNSSITNSYVSGAVSGANSVGGLVGYNDNSSIANSYTNGAVTLSGHNSGGLVGQNEGNAAQINYSYSTVNVTANVGSSNRSGGLVGWNKDEAKVTNSYATGSVVGKDGVGGLVGSNEDGSIIENSYSTGNITGSDSLGGLVGWSDGTITNSFWDTQTSGQTTSAGDATGKTTIEMSYGGMYTGWDIVADSSVTSATPIIKYDGTKYVWAIKPLDLSYTLTTDQSKTYDGVTKNLSDLYTNVFGTDYSFITSGYKFQRSASDVAGYKNAGTYDGIKVVSDSTNEFLTIKVAGSTDGKYVINKATISAITGITASNKTYDGNTNATLNKAGASYVGIIGTDNLSVATATGAFEDKEVGTAKNVSITNLALGGTDAGNYNLALTTASTTANITAVPTPPSPDPIVPTPDPIVPTPDPVVPTPEPETKPKVPENIIRAAENSVTPPIVRLPNTNVPLASTSNLGAGNANPTSNVNVVSQPLSNQSSQSVSLGQLQQSQTNESGPQGAGDIRVPASANSQIILVNGGVKLPEGVEQEFYVSANQNNTSNESKEK